MTRKQNGKTHHLMALAMIGAVCLNPIYSAHAQIGVSSGTGIGVGGTSLGVNADVKSDTIGTVRDSRVGSDSRAVIRNNNDVTSNNRVRLDSNSDGRVDSRDSGSAARSEGNLRAGADVNVPSTTTTIDSGSRITGGSSVTSGSRVGTSTSTSGSTHIGH